MYNSNYIFNSEFSIDSGIDKEIFLEFREFLGLIKDDELKSENIRQLKDSYKLSFFLNDSLIIKGILPAKIITDKIFNLKKSLSSIKNLEDSLSVLALIINVKNFKEDSNFTFKNKNSSLKDLHYFESSYTFLDSYSTKFKYRYYFKSSPKKESNDFIIINNLNKEEIIFNTLKKYLDMDIEYNEYNYNSIISFIKLKSY